MSLSQATQATAVPATATQVKVGIAIYAQKGLYGRPRSPHWALVVHPTTFGAGDVRIYHIRGGSGTWSLCFEVCAIAELGDLLGVLHVADIVLPSTSDSSKKLFDLAELDAFIKKFPATKNGDDPAALFIWTCESYVIRALAHLAEEEALVLPCKPEEMYEYTKRRIAVLKASPPTAYVMSVIPYAE